MLIEVSAVLSVGPTMLSEGPTMLSVVPTMGSEGPAMLSEDPNIHQVNIFAKIIKINVKIR